MIFTNPPILLFRTMKELDKIFNNGLQDQISIAITFYKFY